MMEKDKILDVIEQAIKDGTLSVEFSSPSGYGSAKLKVRRPEKKQIVHTGFDIRTKDFLKGLEELTKDTGLSLVAYSACGGPAIGLYDMEDGDYVATAVGYNDKIKSYEATPA